MLQVTSHPYNRPTYALLFYSHTANLYTYIFAHLLTVCPKNIIFNKNLFSKNLFL